MSQVFEGTSLTEDTGEAPPESSGCAVSGRGSGWWLLGLLPLLGRRRRRDAAA